MTDSVTTQESRARILLAVENAPDPLTVEAIVDRTGLHANTVRGHLDVLMAAGSISRTAADAQGRGRPRWLYRAASPTSSPFQVLAEALSMQLTQVADPALAGRAADQWARALPDLPTAATPDEAVAEATGALNGLGFTAVANPRGDAITITDCPYAELVDANPIICDIHTALVARLLRQTGQPVTIESMEVWTRPGMCAAHLRRPDLVPARTITADDRGTITANERSAS
jgi:predicted ArsR family transcriptional regulator